MGRSTPSTTRPGSTSAPRTTVRTGSSCAECCSTPRPSIRSPFLRIPETVENIIFAASNELQIDLEPRYEEATTSCIVEFAAPPDDFDQALAAACWYVEAAIRGDAAGPDVHWNFSGDGTATPPQDIVFVDILEPVQ
jgi:hypothetical protein